LVIVITIAPACYSDMAHLANGADPKAGFRQRLLDGLAQSIRERGLERTQIGDIVRNAGTSNRTFYECFPNKEECFVQLINEWGEKILVEVRAARDPGAPWQVQIEQTVDAYLGALATDPALTVTASRELATLGSRGLELHEEDIDRYVRLMMEMTGSAEMRAEEIQGVDRRTALMLVGGIAELVDRAARQGESPLALGHAVKRVVKQVIGPGARQD
jgi:AcrR family transcriptional regulator